MVNDLIALRNVDCGSDVSFLDFEGSFSYGCAHRVDPFRAI
ncbi:hypothetical protein KP509_28G034900 [Ceratopteris richardii]|uniref:Uncharacterized protein n=1 Tax=Ceratopteris richardii TaxID=49495 RepID=A0A8T2RDB2_CERRI|nr:hypothetical protein KP509_28G034900 [Ceratopteris richardii]